MDKLTNKQIIDRIELTAIFLHMEFTDARFEEIQALKAEALRRMGDK
jgi:hypothetical protein